MTNVFQLSSDTRFKYWYNLRLSLESSPIDKICIEVDDWWQKAPLVNHYLDSDLLNEWPNPWELLVENNYCHIARGLGVYYTLHLLKVKDIEFVEARDNHSNDVALVLVDSAKYILNYWPNTVVNNNLQDFKITRHIDVSKLIIKIG